MKALAVAVENRVLSDISCQKLMEDQASLSVWKETTEGQHLDVQYISQRVQKSGLSFFDASCFF